MHNARCPTGGMWHPRMDMGHNDANDVADVELFACADSSVFIAGISLVAAQLLPLFFSDDIPPGKASNEIKRSWILRTSHWEGAESQKLPRQLADVSLKPF